MFNFWVGKEWEDEVILSSETVWSRWFVEYFLKNTVVLPYLPFCSLQFCLCVVSHSLKHCLLLYHWEISCHPTRCWIIPLLRVPHGTHHPAVNHSVASLLIRSTVVVLQCWFVGFDTLCSFGCPLGVLEQTPHGWEGTVVSARKDSANYF